MGPPGLSALGPWPQGAGRTVDEGPYDGEPACPGREPGDERVEGSGHGTVHHAPGEVGSGQCPSDERYCEEGEGDGNADPALPLGHATPS